MRIEAICLIRTRTDNARIVAVWFKIRRAALRHFPLERFDQPADVRFHLDFIERQRFNLFRHITVEFNAFSGAAQRHCRMN